MGRPCQHYSVGRKPQPATERLSRSTPVSIGRGTNFPFQVIGFNDFFIGDFSFTPRSIKGAASSPKLLGKKLIGQDLRGVATKGLDLSYLIAWFKLFKSNDIEFFIRASFMDKLAGTDLLRNQIEQGLSEQEIRRSWQEGLSKFKTQRKPYLLYN